MLFIQPSVVWRMPPAARRHCLKKWWAGLPPVSMMLTEALSYGSVWNWISLWLFPRASFTAYTSLGCSVGGFYLAWIHPRHLRVHYLRLDFDFWDTVVLDVVAHQLPRVLSTQTMCFPRCSWFFPRWLVMLYFLVIGVKNIKQRYSLDTRDILSILFLTEFLYFLLFSCPL
jgi:hypothetical protein